MIIDFNNYLIIKNLIILIFNYKNIIIKILIFEKKTFLIFTLIVHCKNFNCNIIFYKMF